MGTRKNKRKKISLTHALALHLSLYRSLSPIAISFPPFFIVSVLFALSLSPLSLSLAHPLSPPLAHDFYLFRSISLSCSLPLSLMISFYLSCCLYLSHSLSLSLAVFLSLSLFLCPLAFLSLVFLSTPSERGRVMERMITRERNIEGEMLCVRFILSFSLCVFLSLPLSSYLSFKIYIYIGINIDIVLYLYIIRYICMHKYI